MATDTRTAMPQGKAPAGKVVEFEQFIDMQLRKTRSQVRNVDVAGACMLLAAGTLTYFLAVAFVDHWVVPGGLGLVGRLLLLVIYLGGAGHFIFRSLAPLLLRRINPVYAAHTIETSKPSLKNSLVNFLLFRKHRDDLPDVIYQALEEQAATNLAGVPLESAVDRGRLIKIGYALVGVLLACAIYKIASPKDPFQTIGRVVMPWADIQQPTRVAILDVLPGNSTGMSARRVIVSAEVRGVSDSEFVRLLYSTADGQTVDQALDMHVPADGYRYQAVLPAGKAGLQQDLTYRIVAGDATSRTYHITVVAAPTIAVESVEYDFPSYTGYSRVRNEHQGDIKAIEGTRVTVHAVANQDIQSAYIDFECDGGQDQQMEVDGRTATTSFVLGWDKERNAPQQSSYQVKFTNSAGAESEQPLQYQIAVSPDLPPTIEFRAPAKEIVALPLGQSLEMQVEASDPDFALRNVKIVATRSGKPLLEKTLLNEEWRGKFQGKLRFEPAKLALKSGEHVEYWAVAHDNKEPAPNRTETARRRITIVSPSNSRNPAEQVASAADNKDPQRDPKANDHDRSGDQRQKPKNSNDDKQQPPDKDRQRSADPKDPEKRDKPDQGNQGEENEPGSEGDSGSNPDLNPQSQDKQGDQPPGAKPPQQPGQKDPQDKQEGGGEGTEQDGSEGQSGSEQGTSGNRSQQNGSGQSGQKGSGQPSEQPVAKGGEADGDAFDRVLEHLRQKNGGANKSGKANGSDGDQSGDGGEDAANDGTDSSDAGPQNGEGSAGRDGAQGSSTDADPTGQDSQGTSGERQPRSRGQSAGDPREQSGDTSERGDDEQPLRPGKEGAPRPPGAKGAKGEKPEGARDAQKDKGDGGEQTNPRDARKQPGGQPERGKNPKNGSAGEKPESKAGRDPGDRQGKGDKAQGTADERKEPSDKQTPDAEGGEPGEDKGDPGAGERTNDAGSPSPQEANRQRDKTSTNSPNEKKQPEEAQSPSTSKRQSDSQGGPSGDKSGGGGSGGGQTANDAGTGGAGQHTASEDGDGQSEGQGEGKTSAEAGRDQTSKGQTGNKGDEKGPGSTTQTGSGAEGGTSEKSGSQGQTVDNTKRQKVQFGPNGKTEGQGIGGTPGGDERSADNQPAPPQGRHKADDPNLEYTRKATDLALERLKHQMDKNQVDQSLLDKLGWTRQDLEKFVNRWEAMRREARQAGPQKEAAQRELDEALRSLGLRPRGTALSGSSARDDQVRGLKESQHTRPPSEYAEQYKAYTQGTARGGK